MSVGMVNMKAQQKQNQVTISPFFKGGFAAVGNLFFLEQGSLIVSAMMLNRLAEGKSLYRSTSRRIASAQAWKDEKMSHHISLPQ